MREIVDRRVLREQNRSVEDERAPDHENAKARKMMRYAISTYVAVFLLASAGWENSSQAAGDENPFGLELPQRRVADRVSITRGIKAQRRETWAELDGPGTINHI